MDIRVLDRVSFLPWQCRKLLFSWRFYASGDPYAIASKKKSLYFMLPPLVSSSRYFSTSFYISTLNNGWIQLVIIQLVIVWSNTDIKTNCNSCLNGNKRKMLFSLLLWQLDLTPIVAGDWRCRVLRRRCIGVGRRCKNLMLFTVRYIECFVNTRLVTVNHLCHTAPRPNVATLLAFVWRKHPLKIVHKNRKKSINRLSKLFSFKKHRKVKIASGPHCWAIVFFILKQTELVA
jgi:hypothetical protein